VGADRKAIIAPSSQSGKGGQLSKGPVVSIFGLLAIAMIAAGCGGGDDSTSTTAALTKAQFLKQGNQICAEGNKEIDAGFEEFAEESNLKKNQEPTQAQKEEIAETILLPSVTRQVEGVGDLGAPSGEEEQVEEIIDAAEEAIEEGEEDPAALVSEGEGSFAKANKLAGEYGLTACGGE
jgi:hypothetical protein